MQIHVAFDTRTETSKGFAYVQYADADAAVEAYKGLDGKHFQGRLLHILPASAKKTYKIDEYELSKLPVKKQKQIKRKMESTSSTFSWNSLYMNVSFFVHWKSDLKLIASRLMLSCHPWLKDLVSPKQTCWTLPLLTLPSSRHMLRRTSSKRRRHTLHLTE